MRLTCESWKIYLLNGLRLFLYVIYKGFNSLNFYTSDRREPVDVDEVILYRHVMTNKSTCFIDLLHMTIFKESKIQ